MLIRMGQPVPIRSRGSANVVWRLVVDVVQVAPTTTLRSTNRSISLQKHVKPTTDTRLFADPASLAKVWGHEASSYNRDASLGLSVMWCLRRF